MRRSSRRDITVGLRDRNDRQADVHRYQMREKLLALGDDYWIETDSGERAFEVDGKAMRIRKDFRAA